MKKLSLLRTCLFLCSLALLTACTKGKYREMEVMEANGMRVNRLAEIVDIREEAELSEGLVQDAKWMPTSKINANHPDWQEFKKSLDKSKMLILYCGSGGRATRIGQKLAEEGYQVGNMGGFRDWQSQKLPVMTKP